MAREHPIGIFDSGVGGLSVLKEIHRQIPEESIHYLGDSHNCPYGSKSREEALFLARKNIEFLLDKNCKLIVIACNTVTAVAIDTFRAAYPVPFIGMEPALKPAAQLTKTKKIGVLATENTFNGRLFRQTCQAHTADIEVFIQPGNGLVELVEEGEQESRKARELLKSYLLPMMEKGADTIVLGCTHYPFLKNSIHRITQGRLSIIDPAGAVAAQTRRVLKNAGLSAGKENSPKLHFFTTGRRSVAKNLIAGTLDMPGQIEKISPLAEKTF